MPDDVTIYPLDAEALAMEAWHHSVALLRLNDDRSTAAAIGSGTLVSAGGNRGILTAAHVLTALPNSGEIGLVRSPPTPPFLQNQTIEMSYTEKVLEWDGVEKSSPDIGFLKLPSNAVTYIEAVGGVFYNLDRDRTVPPGIQFVRSTAIVGLVAEWVSEMPGDRVNTKILDVRSIFGATDISKGKEPHDLICRIDYLAEIQSPSSYGGLSGGGLWQYDVEIIEGVPGKVHKKIIGVAYRELPQDEMVIVCQSQHYVDIFAERIRALG